MNISQSSGVLKICNYLSNSLLLVIALYLYKNLSFYNSWLCSDSILIIKYYIIGYIIIILPFNLFPSKIAVKPGSSFLSITFIIKITLILISKINSHLNAQTDISEKEKTAIKFIIVKFFFMPIMLNFFVSSFNSVWKNTSLILNLPVNYELWGINSFNLYLYPVIFSCLLLIDTGIFTFGYMVESDYFENRIKSVDSTFFGWAVALACYPPFNSLVFNQFGQVINDYPRFESDLLTFIVRAIGLVLLIVYVSASVALGAKASNLTNRGIVKKWPYSIIRHPAYVSKNLMWWIFVLPNLSLSVAIKMSIISLIYFLRAITEEMHLRHDPDYQKYCSEVTDGFLPTSMMRARMQNT